jgi:hypothetical protein
MQKLFLLIVMYVGTFSAMGQAQAGTYASVNIVSPVGAELSTRMDPASSAMNAYQIVSTSFNQHDRSIKPSCTEHIITSAASLKIIGSINVYDLFIHKDTIILRSVEKNSIRATVSLGDLSSSHQGEASDATIIIAAKLEVDATQPKGLYKSTTPYNVTINYN